MNRGTVVGVAVAHVEGSGAQAGCLEVGRDARLVQDAMVSAQQCGADARALLAGANGEHRQVVVGGAGRVMAVQCGRVV